VPAVVLAALLLPSAAPAQSPSPVMRGDWPDPDVTLIGGSYYAVATSGGWAPTFRILRSSNLQRWRVAGSVFKRPPRWTVGSYWAPELAPLPSGGYATFYSASPRPVSGRGKYCLGVATAPSPLGPWRDLGRPLRCARLGSIDPTPVVDGGRLYLVYKVDGNAIDHPTPVLLQELRADGRALLGAPRELLRNDPTRWEGKVIEAPALMRRGNEWLMLYSGGLCCSRNCAYAVGAARAPTLAGPWRKYEGNPILRSGNGWRCPGHVSIVGDRVAFHAYREGAGLLAGRQMHLAPLSFRADGWPAVGNGLPLPPTAGALPTAFDDRFGRRSLAPEWEWPAASPPSVRLAGGLRLTAPRRAGTALDAALLGRRIGSDRFVATAVVQASQLRRGARAGLAVLRGGPFSLGDQAVGIAVGGNGGVTTWRRDLSGYVDASRRYRKLTGHVHLRLAAAARRYRLADTSDGRRWRTEMTIARGPVEETARVALTAGGTRAATGRFRRATLVER
jgi:beta-xylosidase